MTRQEAVWHANHVFNIVIERCINAQNLKDAREFDEAKQIVIKALEQEPKWIPCSERLPEIGDTVIISGKMKYKGDKDYEEFVDVAIFEVTQRFETFNDWYEGQDEFEIVAWQPLPEPYEESDGK